MGTLLFLDRMGKAKDAFRLALDLVYRDDLSSCRPVKGEVFIEIVDSNGDVIESRHLTNIVVLDASILAARLFKDNAEPPHGINMLSVGTGATGALLSPDAPDPRQRKLNAELARKAFSSTTFRDASGNAVSYPTNIVDFTTRFGEAEAVGPLNEMGLLSTISDNPSIKHPNPDAFPTRDVTKDLTLYDILVNYLTFSVISKPSSAAMTITWRLTF